MPWNIPLGLGYRLSFTKISPPGFGSRLPCTRTSSPAFGSGLSSTGKSPLGFGYRVPCTGTCPGTSPPGFGSRLWCPPEGPVAPYSTQQCPAAFKIFFTTKSPKHENSQENLAEGGGSKFFYTKNEFIGTPFSDKLGCYRFQKSKEVGGYMKVRS